MNKLEIINETVEYYGKDPLQLRATTPDDCVYMDDQGNRCAIGRCIAEEYIYMAREVEGPVSDLLRTLRLPLDTILQEKYRGHDLFFWEDVQSLHDHEPYWDYEKGGLTPDGERQVSHLKEKYRNWG